MDPSRCTIGVKDVSKAFGRFVALDRVSFQASGGELICILGPSGCGKTTLLRVVAGLDTQDRGKVFMDGKEISNLPVSRRNVGIVFQSYALFPNMTAEQNIAYGLQARSMDRRAVKRRVEELLELVGLEGLGRKYPAHLSGGQQQRVALARAIAGAPSLLLLDEPLSALDAKVRLRLRSEIRQLQQRLGITTLMVTHDQEEALAMADTIMVMDQGQLLQVGAPGDIYDNPANPFVASFIGSMNFIHDTVREAPGIYRKGPLRLAVKEPLRSLTAARAILAIRPEDILLHHNGEGSQRGNVLAAQVKRLEYRGANYRVSLEITADEQGTSALEADIPTEKIRRLHVQENMHVHIGLPEDRMRVYAA